MHMNRMRLSVLDLLFLLQLVFLFGFSICLLGYTEANRPFRLPEETEPIDDHLLVHTLKGEILLVHRLTGLINWTRQLDPALQVTYNRGPILIVDPVEARLYEYSSDASDDLFTHLDHSVMGYIRRSPTYYKNFITFGSKNDFWISLDLRTGTLVHAVDQTSIDQCPGQVYPTAGSDSESSKFSADAVLGLGRTQYNLLFRDPATGTPRLNITYNTFASHADPESQSCALQHVTTTHPSLLTFEGRKILWSLPLSSPVVGLYTVRTPATSTTARNCRTVSQVPTYVSTEHGHSTFVNDSELGTTDSRRQASEAPPVVPPEENKKDWNNLPVVECHSSKFESSPLAAPYILKRIAFTTYVIDVPPGFSTHSDLLRSYLQAKFNGTMDLALSLVVDKSESAPLYAIPCVTESTIPLRGIRRTPDQFLLEGPEMTTAFPANPYINWDNWSQGVLGLYELPPTQLSRWSSRNEIPLWARLPRVRQITAANTGWNVIIPPSVVADDLTGSRDQVKLVTAEGTLDQHLHLHFVYRSTLLPVGCVLLVCILIWTFKQSKSTLDPNFLPPTFDLPNSDGWAGCTADEAGQPEDIRFNLKQVLGHGANGTMVFAGTFGKHETAVKRIVRQPHLEKHWRREHAILLHHHHPNLVRCFWTGSTANFHYLVMQRCAASLTDLFRGESNTGFAKWGLVPTQVIHQIVLGVASLHQNQIVHRDLKPSNILITCFGNDAHVVVGDFGLSRPLAVNRQELTTSFGLNLLVGYVNPGAQILGKHGSSVTYGDSCIPGRLLEDLGTSDQTSVGVAYGTLGWMAPELCDPDIGSLTYAVDVFSCGLLAYHILTYGGHPFDHCNGPLSERPSTGSKGAGSVNGSGSFVQSAATSSSASGSEVGDGLSYQTAARLNRHHARQLAIAENRPPALDRLTEGCSNISAGFLSRHLIQMMLSHNPQRRPTAEEVVAHPLFWSSNKIMHFISELSDILDTREDLLREARGNGAGSNAADTISACAKLRSDVDHFLPQRISLLDDIESSSPWVFNEHWFYRLESELVHDLLSTRGYQDTSLMDLLRAIRNKRNHIWHLRENIRDLLGHTQEGMASYWTSRFPSLLPLLYSLSRCRLTGCSAMAEYLPPPGVGQIPAVSDVYCDWWRTTPAGKELENTVTIEVSAINEESPGKQPCSTEQLVRRRHPTGKPWRRGEVVLPVTSEQSTTHASDPPNELNMDLELEVSAPLVTEDKAASEESGTFIVVCNSRPRKRPNHPKKVRPPKKKIDRGHQLTTAGCELPLHAA